MDDYKDAEEDAQVTAVGIWNDEADRRAYRELNKNVSDVELVKKYKGTSFTATV